MKIFDLRQTESFSVTDPFLTSFHYVEKRNGILRNNRVGRGLKNLTYTYIGVWGGVKNCQNHPYVIMNGSLVFSHVQ